MTKLSYSRPGTPTDNPYSESLMSTVEREVEASLVNANSIEEIKFELKRWIRYYNSKRLHSGIDYRTPNTVFNLAFKT